MEVLLAVGSKKVQNYHIILNSKGTVWDEKNLDSKWSIKNFQLSNGITKNTWTAEMVIPFEDLGVT